MDTATISLVISIIAFIISISIFFILNKKQKIATTEGSDGYTSRPLQLQAYERLVMLSERIALPSLISRVNQPGLSLKEMQLLLLENIKQEYEYNMTQQIYVSPVACLMRYNTGSRISILGEDISIFARSVRLPSGNSPFFILSNRSRFSSTLRLR